MTRQTLKNRIPASQLFLMELLLSLLLFSVAAASSVTIFVRAHQMSGRAASLGRASEDLSSYAELIRSSGTWVEVLERTRSAYPHAELTADSVLIFFDENNEETDRARAASQMGAVLSMRDAMLHAELGVSEDPECDLLKVLAGMDPEAMTTADSEINGGADEARDGAETEPLDDADEATYGAETEALDDADEAMYGAETEAFRMTEQYGLTAYLQIDHYIREDAL